MHAVAGHMVAMIMSHDTTLRMHINYKMASKSKAAAAVLFIRRSLKSLYKYKSIARQYSQLTWMTGSGWELISTQCGTAQSIRVHRLEGLLL